MLPPEQLRTLKGKSGFLQYYEALFSNGETTNEFEQFIASLQKETYPSLRTRSSTTSKLQRTWNKQNLPWNPIAWNTTAVAWPEGTEKGTPLPGVEDHLLYAMNASSLLPVMALQPQAGETILDACAAPGGKALYIADLLNHTGELLANDTSPKRRARLQQALNDYGHSDAHVLGAKAETLFKRQQHGFDRILVDAPCSSEKHVYGSPQHLDQWTYNRVKSLAQRQIAILSGLFLALKPGGRMVYSTCAVNTEENEGVIARLLRKKGDGIRLIPFTDIVTDPTVPGAGGLPGNYKQEFDLSAVRRILPHKETMPNLDPMFVAIFERV